MACSTILATVCFTAALTIPWMEYVAGGAAVLGGIAGIVQFFASMLYLRWMAPRIPSPLIERRSQLYMWLLPVIYVVGSCFVVGPLVATIMYFLLLNLVRIDLRNIIARQHVVTGASD